MKVKENRETLPKRTLLGTPTTTTKETMYMREKVAITDVAGRAPTKGG
jgi:hypothetical protein